MKPTTQARQISHHTLSSLKHRNYMLLWVGTLISHSGDWMDTVALNWLVLVLSGSPLYLGLVNLSRALPVLVLTLVAGVIVDRMERRKLLMITQAGAMALAFALAVLVATGHAQIWHIFVIGTLRGVVMAFNMPTRQTIISDLVPRSDLANAIALNSATLNVTRVIGPALAGVLIASAGASTPFFLNGISFLAVLYTLHAMKLPEQVARTRHTAVWHDLKEGLVYIRSNTTILALVMIAVVPMFLGNPYTSMLTVFAKDVLNIGPMGLGILTSSAAAGAVCGALIVATLGDFRHRGSLMLGSMFGFGVMLCLFSFSPWPILSVFLVILTGGLNMMYNSSNNTMLQLMAPDEMRGRIMSTLFLNRAMVPMGTAMAGALATVVGAPLAMGSMAALVAIIAVAARLAVPTLTAPE